MRLQEIVAILLLSFTVLGSAWSQPAFSLINEYFNNGQRQVSDQRAMARTYDLDAGLPVKHANESAWTQKRFNDAEAIRWLSGGTEEYPIRILITSATTRSFNAETRKLKSMTRAYNKTVQKLIAGKDHKSRRFRKLEAGIIVPYQEMLDYRISQINGVKAQFGTPFLGSWQGEFEPSFDLILQISEKADTERLSDILHDLAERTSQDAFIIEMKSKRKNAGHSTFFDDVGHLHYPQILVHFEPPLTIPQRATVARTLHDQGIREFSIGEAYFFVSIIFPDDYSPDPITSHSTHFDRTMHRINQAMNELARVPGIEFKKMPEILYRKSLYVEAMNAENQKDPSRKYIRHNIFETHHRFFPAEY